VSPITATVRAFSDHPDHSFNKTEETAMDTELAIVIFCYVLYFTGNVMFYIFLSLNEGQYI